MKVILITGASSGIGYEAAQRLARRGCHVYAAARRVELMEPLRKEGVVPVKLDVCDEESMRQCVDTVLQAEGRIDVLVNNAGYGYFGAVEKVSDAVWTHRLLRAQWWDALLRRFVRIKL